MVGVPKAMGEYNKFQSTRPRRGAICNCWAPGIRSRSFNPRAPGGAR